jgi:hypothetical protein
VQEPGTIFHPICKSQDLSSIQCEVNMTLVGQICSRYKIYSPVFRYFCTSGYYPDFWAVKSFPSNLRMPRGFVNSCSFSPACANEILALTLTETTADECMGDVSEVQYLRQVECPGSLFCYWSDVNDTSSATQSSKTGTCSSTIDDRPRAIQQR